MHVVYQEHHKENVATTVLESLGQSWIFRICPESWNAMYMLCENRRSTLCTTIHGLYAQSVDPCFAQHSVRCHKLKGKDAITERDCDWLLKGMLGIHI